MEHTKLTAKDIKAMTGAENRWQGESMLYQQLEARQWRLGDRESQVAGYDRRKDLVHFTATWSAGAGCAGHRRVGVPLKVALANQSGVLDQYVVLC